MVETALRTPRSYRHHVKPQSAMTSLRNTVRLDAYYSVNIILCCHVACLLTCSSICLFIYFQARLSPSYLICEISKLINK